MTIQPAFTVSTGTRLNPTVEAIDKTWLEGLAMSFAASAGAAFSARRALKPVAGGW
jgi:hypothetical protein